MKQLITVVITAAGLVFFVASQSFASERSVLARITVYWHGEGSGHHASWNGAQLHEGHCAVDPKKIPYGSKVVFPDAACVAVDSGPDVIDRKAARSCGRNVAERSAIVVDRFFDNKQKALAWAKAHSHFMTLRILTPGTKLLATKASRSSPTKIANNNLARCGERLDNFKLALDSYWTVPMSPSPNIFLQYARRRT